MNRKAKQLHLIPLRQYLEIFFSFHLRVLWIFNKIISINFRENQICEEITYGLGCYVLERLHEGGNGQLVGGLRVVSSHLATLFHSQYFCWETVACNALAKWERNSLFHHWLRSYGHSACSHFCCRKSQETDLRWSAWNKLCKLNFSTFSFKFGASSRQQDSR